MGKEEIVSRILSDAEAEAAEILRLSRERAEGIISAAEERAAKERIETETEANERAKCILEGKAASARLDSAKIVLAEKRRVMDEIYARALNKLLDMFEYDALKLLTKLLSEYAEEGDEIVFAENFAFAESAAALPIIDELKLTISAERVNISGGCILRGKRCDKDLSYSALLNADREEYQAKIAAKLFVS